MWFKVKSHYYDDSTFAADSKLLRLDRERDNIKLFPQALDGREHHFTLTTMLFNVLFSTKHMKAATG